ncbi:MAG: TerC family protein [Anaerolineales bacterium]|nr:TerC family protein [Anaerolineales bacterium]
MEWLAQPETWISLLTLTVLEIVLGIDNIVFISILADKLAQQDRGKARQIGLALAMIMRILLLLSISWLIGLTKPLFHVASLEFSGRDLILLTGGLFLLGKATFEIHEKLEGEEHDATKAKASTLMNVVVQIMLLDIVFSLDSVITAVGMAEHVAIMIAAVVIAVIIMLLSVDTISDFISQHPTIKILALSFLLLIGFSLSAEGLGQHIPKGYIYFAMGFSIFVEFLNLRLSQRQEPVTLRGTVHPPKPE